MKRFLIVSVPLALIAAVAALSASGKATSDMSFVTHQREFAQIDVGKKGFSVGDSFIFSEQISQGGKPVGFDHVICTHAADWPRSAEHCSGTITLGAEQLALEGDARRGPFTIAVVGGTGRYAGARGTADIASHGSSGTLKIHLS